MDWVSAVASAGSKPTRRKQVDPVDKFSCQGDSMEANSPRTDNGPCRSQYLWASSIRSFASLRGSKSLGSDRTGVQSRANRQTIDASPEAGRRTGSFVSVFLASSPLDNVCLVYFPEIGLNNLSPLSTTRCSASSRSSSVLSVYFHFH